MVRVALQWDDQAVEHVARHGVAVEEVEEVASTGAFLIRARYGRDMVYGKTEAGRRIIVVVERIRGNLYYPITAYPMSKTQQRFYERVTKGE